MPSPTMNIKNNPYDPDSDNSDVYDALLRGKRTKGKRRKKKKWTINCDLQHIHKRERNKIISNTINSVGTFNSRSGRYIRPSWDKVLNNYATVSIKLFGLFFIIILTITAIQAISVNLIKHHSMLKNGHGCNNFGKVNEIYTRDIDEWCVECVSPLDPDDKLEYEWWKKSATLNLELIDNASSDLDVVLLGDSIIEHWNGRSMGALDSHLNKIKNTFDELFQKENGGKVNGLALGITNDTSSNLLYRLQNGELPQTLNPKVWWLLIGTNDLGNTECVEEITLLGIFRVVEEILRYKQNSTIVINGILPRTDRADGHLGGSLSEDEADFNLWSSIKRINKKLQAVADEIDNVEFVDSSEFFLIQLENAHYTGEKILVKGLMEDFFHPSAYGYKVWGEQIVNYTLNSY